MRPCRDELAERAVLLSLDPPVQPIGSSILQEPPYVLPVCTAASSSVVQARKRRR
jgi:hypothetical protein